MNKEEFLKAIENLPKTDSINSISSYNSINIKDLANAVDRFKKVPTYDELLKENKILKENAENNDKVVDNVNWENQLLKKENEQLKDNWNKLKEYLNYKSERAVGEDEYVYDEIYNEMQELEKGSDSNE